MDCFPKFTNRPFQITYKEDDNYLWFDIYLLIDKGLRVAYFKFRTCSSTVSKEEQISKITAYFRKKLEESL